MGAVESHLSLSSSEEEEEPVRRLSNHFFADLLLRLPLHSTLSAVITACEPDPSVLFWTWMSLYGKGKTPPDYARTLPETDRAKDCPKLEEESSPPLGQQQQRQTCRLLACGHSFHESCLERWFGARETCPVCPPDPEARFQYDFPSVATMIKSLMKLKKKKKKTATNDNEWMTLQNMRDEISYFLQQHYSDHFSEWSERLENPVPEEDRKLFDLSTLPLKLPYRSVVNVILTLFERRPSDLIKIIQCLKKDGIPRDVVSTLPETDRVRDCPKRDPMRLREEEGGRVLGCGHSFHETCLRTWFAVRKDCPACQRQVDWSESMPPPLPERRYVNEKMDRISIEEMAESLSDFLKMCHVDFCKKLVTRRC